MERKKRIFRQLNTLAEAQALFFGRFERSAFGGLDSETVAVRHAYGRILAAAVQVERSVPAYQAAAMDGLAVRAADTFAARPESPVCLPKDRAVLIDTGQPMPGGTDAVVLIESVEDAGDGWEIREPAYPGRHVRKAGEDMVHGEILLPARHRLRAYDQAALLAAGLLSVEVVRRPRVLIVPTGAEIVAPEQAPPSLPAGAIVEVDGQMLASLAAACGAAAEIHTSVSDIRRDVKGVVEAGVAEGYDLILVIAGSSAGSEDFVAPVLAEMGTLLVHGVAVMPGKPVLLAEIQGRPVVGVPGYPVSAAITFREFVGPLLYRMQGLLPPQPRKVEAVLARKLPSRLGLEEHVRVLLGNVGGCLVAVPAGGGAGSLSSLVRADGIIRVPQASGGMAQGQTASVELLVPAEVLDDRLVAVGSHDLTIDLLSSLLKERTRGRVQISSSNVGSLGGLLAVRQGTAHFAGSHLLDTETGDYNRSYVRKYVPGVPVTVVTLVQRLQGFMVAPSNPKKIRGIDDLGRGDVVLVNRQPGSGTRILLDYELGQAGIDPQRVAGYRNEEYTHMNVAMAVASGAADVGLGIRAAADALSLDFIAVTTERYDLVIPTAFLEDDKIGLMLEIIRSEAFKSRVLELGGYEVEQTGRIIEPI